jgi:hypothetical protein
LSIILASAASSGGSKSFSVLVRIDFTIIVDYFGERSELSRLQILFGYLANRLHDYCQLFWRAQRALAAPNPFRFSCESTSRLFSVILASAASSGGSKSFSVFVRIDFTIIVDYFCERSELSRLQILFGSLANRLHDYCQLFW